MEKHKGMFVEQSELSFRESLSSAHQGDFAMLLGGRSIIKEHNIAFTRSELFIEHVADLLPQAVNNGFGRLKIIVTPPHLGSLDDRQRIARGPMRAVKNQGEIQFARKHREASEDFTPARDDIFAMRRRAVPGQTDLANRADAIAMRPGHRQRRLEVIIGELEALRMKSDRGMHEVGMVGRERHYAAIRRRRRARRDDSLHSRVTRPLD